MIVSKKSRVIKDHVLLLIKQSRFFMDDIDKYIMYYKNYFINDPNFIHTRNTNSKSSCGVSHYPFATSKHVDETIIFDIPRIVFGNGQFTLEKNIMKKNDKIIQSRLFLLENIKFMIRYSDKTNNFSNILSDNNTSK